MIKSHLGILIAVTAVLVVLVTAFGLRAENDSTFLGMQIPYVTGIIPDTVPDLLLRNAVFDRGGLRSAVWLRTEDSLPKVSFPVQAGLLFYLSAAGTVDSIGELENHGKDFLKRVKNSLLKIPFQPARYMGQAVPFVLQGNLLVRPRRNEIQGSLILPYDPRTGYHNENLIEKSLIRNGYSLPAILKFPPYFCPFKLGANSGVTPFVVYEVDLDTLGEPSDITEYCSSYISFSNPIFRSLLHAQFTAAKYGSQRITSRIYVTVRFFERIKYPTGEWPPAQSDSTADLPFDHCRVSYSLYPDSILTPPIPENIHDGTFSYEPYFLFKDTVRVFVRIDTRGRISSAIPAHLRFQAMQTSLDSVMKALIFEPARDKWDRAVPFEGELLMKGDFSEKIRIDVLWLPSEAQRGVRLID